MSNRSKNNKNQEKAAVINPQKTEQPLPNSALTLNPISSALSFKNQPISPKDLNPIPSPSNLMIVKQASVSSQDGNSKKGSVVPTSKNRNDHYRSQFRQGSSIDQLPARQEEATYEENNILLVSGVLDAYEHFLKLLCKNGLPNGKIYQYAAQQILKYEKHKINKELKMRAELDIQKIVKKNDRSSPSPEKSRALSPYQF